MERILILILSLSMLTACKEEKEKQKSKSEQKITNPENKNPENKVPAVSPTPVRLSPSPTPSPSPSPVPTPMLSSPIAPSPKPTPALAPSPAPSPSPSPQVGSCANNFLVGKWTKDSNPSIYIEFRADCTAYISQCNYTIRYAEESDQIQDNENDPAWLTPTSMVAAFITMPHTGMINCGPMANWMANHSTESQLCDFANISQNHMQINCTNQAFTYFSR